MFLKHVTDISQKPAAVTYNLHLLSPSQQHEFAHRTSARSLPSKTDLTTNPIFERSNPLKVIPPWEPSNPYLLHTPSDTTSSRNLSSPQLSHENPTRQEPQQRKCFSSRARLPEKKQFAWFFRHHIYRRDHIDEEIMAIRFFRHLVYWQDCIIIDGSARNPNIAFAEAGMSITFIVRYVITGDILKRRFRMDYVLGWMDGLRMYL